MPRDGGTPQPIADCANPRGAGTWTRDNTIIFMPEYDGPVVRVSASGTTALGSLFFTQNGTLVSGAFDARSETLTGDVTQIAPNVAAFSASEAGTLAHFATPRGINLSQRITWFSRDGTRLRTTGEPGTISDPRISRDGSQLAVARRNERGVADIWTYDVARDAGTPATLNGGVMPVWSPDGGSLLYSGSAGIHRTSLGGDASARSMPGMPTRADPEDWSPDSRWIAYMSNESGRYEIYVKPVPGPGPRRPVSTGGRDYPVWGPGGKEIYYRGPESMLTAQSVNGSGSTFVVVGTPQTLFKMTGVAWNFLFDTHDGKQFVMVVASERDPSPLTIVVNWTPPRH